MSCAFVDLLFPVRDKVRIQVYKSGIMETVALRRGVAVCQREQQQPGAPSGAEDCHLYVS